MFPGHAACKGAIVKTSDVVKRYTSLAVSLFFNALGIALITQAHLGTTPITTLPYTLAAIFGLTLGTTTFACNLLFLLLQRILLRRRLGIAARSRKNFGNIKVLFDCSLVLASCLLGLAVLGSIVGLREGTVLSAVLVGMFARLSSPWTRKLKPLLWSPEQRQLLRHIKAEMPPREK